MVLDEDGEEVTPHGSVENIFLPSSSARTMMHHSTAIPSNASANVVGCDNTAAVSQLRRSTSMSYATNNNSLTIGQTDQVVPRSIAVHHSSNGSNGAATKTVSFALPQTNSTSVSVPWVTLYYCPN